HETRADEQDEENRREGEQNANPLPHVVKPGPEDELASSEVEARRLGAGELSAQRQRECLGEGGMVRGGDVRRLGPQLQKLASSTQRGLQLLSETRQPLRATAQVNPIDRPARSRGESLEGRPPLSNDGLQPPAESVNRFGGRTARRRR